MKLATAFAALVMVTALPAAAQMPPPGEMTPDGPGRNPDVAGRMRREPGRMPGNSMFAGMTDAGKAIMRTAMRDADPRTDRAATDAARDRMLTVLDADRLDPGALKRAMDDEREAASVAKARHQSAMIAGFQQLSLADRRAFVVNARAVRNVMKDRIAFRDRREPRGPAAMPPPQ